MRKFIGTIVVGLLMASSVYAAKVKTINMVSTKLDSVTFQVRYDRDTGAIQDVRLSATAVIYDDAGEAIGRHTETSSWADIPSVRRAEAKSFLQWVSGVINNKAVAENVEQEMP